MSLDDFLAGKAAEQDPTVKFGSKCSICNDPKCAEEVASFVKKRQTGEVAHSINWIWQHYFLPVHQVTTAGSLRNHIRVHLGVTDL